MARLPVPGGDDGQWGEILNNFLRIEHNTDGTQKTVPVRRGGTGATNTDDARASLGLHSNIPIFIQPHQPASPLPYLWIQTGLGSKGDGMSFWIDDGL